MAGRIRFLVTTFVTDKSHRRLRRISLRGPNQRGTAEFSSLGRRVLPRAMVTTQLLLCVRVQERALP